MLKTDLKIYQSSQISQIRDILANHTQRAYLVGGSLRDAFLGIENVDFDIEVYDILPNDFSALMKEIGANEVGKSYFIYKFKNYDIGLARSESCVGCSHKDFVVSYCDDERLASMRRDFSINSIMLNIFTGEILDFWGGISDLENRILSHNDDEKFCEDSLRILRGIQFAARFNLKIHPHTLKLMKEMSIDNLSQDRIKTELLKFFDAKYLDVGFFYLCELGLLMPIFGVEASKDSIQEFINILIKARKTRSEQSLFLYLFCGFFKLDVGKILDRLGLSKKFKSLKNEPFLNEIDEVKLMQIALTKPISEWLGAYDSSVINMAKKLGIYYHKLEIDVDMSSIIKQGYKAKEIQIKKTQIQLEKIHQILSKQ